MLLGGVACQHDEEAVGLLVTLLEVLGGKVLLQEVGDAIMPIWVVVGVADRIAKLEVL